MKKYLLILHLLTTTVTGRIHAQSKHSAGSSFPSYKGLVMAGYQGWFNTPDDGAGRGWTHFVAHGEFGPGNAKVDLWPEVREYKKNYKTPFKKADSTPAYLFSSYDASTTDLHFSWMQQYGVDGVFMQRFIGSTRGGKSLAHNDKILLQAVKASRKYQRAIAVMYDLSGMKDDDMDPETVINDWKHLVDDLQLTSRGKKQTYLYHNGKPLVAVWGVGFPGRSYGLKGAEKILDFLKNDPVYGGCSVLLGVPTYWRDLSNDAMKDPHFHDLLRKADIIQPWMVGRYNGTTYSKFPDRIKADIDWCRQNHVDYVPVVFPGFSWHNMYPKNPQDQIPRNKGRFYWEQITGAISSGAEMLYVAMFDEIDEGTAIFKISKNPPVGASNFVKFEDDIPEDYYLFLTGYAAKMLRKEKPFAREVPAPPGLAGETRSQSPAKPARDISPGRSFTSWVDPLIGSGGHGHVFVGASVPFGAVQLGPENFYKGWDWCSGYNYRDSMTIGFAHTHLNGTGIGDLADILIMPYTGPVKTDKGVEKIPGSGYASHYSHSTEKVRPGYYTVTLDSYDIRVELTATERVGFHQYQFPAGKEAHIIIDLKEGINDRATDTHIEQADAYTLKGYRRSKGWAKDQQIFFAIRLPEPLKNFRVYNNDKLLEGTAGQGDAIKGLISFDKAPARLQLKCGISPVSMENALANIEAEIPHWDFQAIADAADRKWNKELSKIGISTSSERDKRIFYSSLYHTMIDPALFNDHNGDYRGADKNIVHNAPFKNYSVFSLWDTYRALHPLYTLTQPERVNDMINSLLAIYRQQGRLPIWHLMGNETGTMVGISSLQVIAEAYIKGFRGFDTAAAFEAVKNTAMGDSLGLLYLKQGLPIPSDIQSRSVARALEYAIADASIALMARQMGRMEDYHYFLKRSKSYQLYFDPVNRFFRGRLADRSWNPNFDPLKSYRPWAADYAEGNAWQYLWLTPQDPEGLAQLLGGREAFLNRLDTFFRLVSPPDSNALDDLTGLIGQYAHGNEPSHHIAYLYSYMGEEWKTAEKTRYILKEFYRDQPDGIIGNEDCGQMSAWYIFSSMGFYPLLPASGKYWFGSPLFDKTTIHLGQGRQFIIESVDNSDKNIYISRIELNGKPYPKNYILHSDIIKGGRLKIFMSDTRNKNLTNEARLEIPAQ